MGMSDTMTEKLNKAFSPQSLNIVNESHLHAGHGGHTPNGESHFRVHIVSDAFNGKSRLEGGARRSPHEEGGHRIAEAGAIFPGLSP